MRIIMDAMGGDNAPQEIVKGALLALRDFDDIDITFTGDKSAIQKCLEGESFDSERINIVHTTEVIEMAEHPVDAVRKKKDSSMVVGMNLVKDGEGDALITAGSTGAVVAGGTLILRRLPGIKRPALAPVLPTMKNGALLIDCGANVDCKPVYLQQFGIMGSIYMKAVMGIQNPRVGLINNGSEEEKGCSLTKEAYKLLKQSDINFVGNVEGREVLSGEFDVLVCDGFVGNILMKFMEGMAKAMFSMLKEEIKTSKKAQLGMLAAKGSLRNFKKKMDYSEYGGVLLLGVDGGIVKAHGSSDRKAIYSAIKQTRLFVSKNVVETIKVEIEKAGIE